MVAAPHVEDCDGGEFCHCGAAWIDAGFPPEDDRARRDMECLSAPGIVGALRERLDDLDDLLAKLLMTRLVAARLVLEAKSRQGGAVTDRKREIDISRRLVDAGLPAEFVAVIWAEVFREVKRGESTSFRP